MESDFTFAVGLKSNKETNDFLRCLWSRLGDHFGGIGWEYSPVRTENVIFVGFASIGNNILLAVSLIYKERGCLSKIDFSPSGYKDAEMLKKQLKQCIEEAFDNERYLKERFIKGKLDKNLSFKKRTGKNFSVGGNDIILKIRGYDTNDCGSMFKMLLQQVCNLLTFDTLRYVTYSGTLTEEMREKHNFVTNLVVAETGKVADSIEKNERYRGLAVSDYMADYIDEYLERPYMYEEHHNLFDVSTQLFAQAVRNEEMADIMAGLPEPFVELAITNYMSALEVITLNDKEPETCECCGQTKYSIARRVSDLMEQAVHNGKDIAKKYYGNRSKFLHAGILLSSNSYSKCSIPLMSKNTYTGLLDQLSILDPCIKETVKECIIWHECQRGKDVVNV